MAKAIWSKYNIPKYSFILWLVSHGKLLTRDRLKSWNVRIEDDKCVLCNGEIESIDHLFFKCRYSRELVIALASWLQITNIPIRMSEWQHWLIHQAGKPHIRGKICVTVMSTAVALLWKERNARIHGKKMQTVQQCFFKLRQEVSIKVMAKITRTKEKKAAQNILHLK